MHISDPLRSLIDLETDWRNHTINLNASENYTSASVKKMLSHPSYDFYAFPPSGGNIEGTWRFSGPPYLQRIDDHINKLGKELLNCESLDTRPKGGQAAEIAVLTSLAKAGDTVFYVQESDGGHFGLNFMSQKMGVRLVPICFDSNQFKIDIDKTINLMQSLWKGRKDRKLVMIGQSFVLCEQPLKKLVEQLKDKFSDVVICYDVSHTLGLIIGRQFTNPILQGVDFIHGSTHKTFPGPQKGFIGFPRGFNKALREQIQYAVSPGLQSNCGTAEILALALALEEMKIYGKEYAKAICSNAKYLAACLDDEGFQIAAKHFGFTHTHQIWLMIGEEQDAWRAFGDLHHAGIRCYPAYLPFVKTWGLRLSTNAITRLGFKERQIAEVAYWIKEVLIDKAATHMINQNVKKLMSTFSINNVHYTFSNEHAYA